MCDSWFSQSGVAEIPNIKVYSAMSSQDQKSSKMEACSTIYDRKFLFALGLIFKKNGVDKNKLY
jgi:hypothetical protein